MNMNIFYAIILGIIQGLTEFLPISSTAHLTLAGKFLNLIDASRPEDWTAFIAIMQLGTVAAVIVYFIKDINGMVNHFFSDLLKVKSAYTGQWSYESKLLLKIILGTIPVALIGLLFKHIIEGAFTKEISTIATSLIVLGLLLFFGEKLGKRSRDEKQTTWIDALVIGFAQALALIPGSSRSGTTITAGLFLGLTREAAARFSFLLSIPAVMASGLFELYQVRHHLGNIGVGYLIVSTIVSAIVGYATISFLLKYLQKHTTYLFIFYRILLGGLLWAFIAMKVL
jgi:undecaprenyl-diphosphatase